MNSLTRFMLALSLVASSFVFTSRAVAQTYAERIIEGFEWPLFGVAAPNNPSRMYAGRTWLGRIDIIDLNTRTVSPTPFIDISAELPNPLNNTEQGILGMTFDPDYLNNGYVYVDFTKADNSVEVRRYTALGNPETANAVDPNSGHTIINIQKDFQYWHNAGWIDFSPKDGYLYINVGDPGAPNGSQAQVITNNLNGKVLRVDVHSDAFPDDPTRNYAIPPSNPFVDKVGDDEIWAYGLRNPWRAAFDRQTGDLWINDTGEGTKEEVNYQPADDPGGHNYGWARREGTVDGPPGHTLPAGPEFTEPVYDYDHNDPNPLYRGQSITGSVFYRGPVAAFQGFYMFTDFSDRNIWSIDPDAVNMRASVLNINAALPPDFSLIKGVASFGEDSLGNVYLMEYDGPTQGEVWKISTHSKDAVWNGNSATYGAAGDGTTWGSAANWTRATTVDDSAVDQDYVVFAAGSSQPLISLGTDRVVSGVAFSAPYTLTGNQLKVLSGNISVDSGVTATINSNLAAETVNRSIRKLGSGTLIVNGASGQLAVKEGTLGGTGTFDYLTVRKDATVNPGTTGAGIMHVVHDFKLYEQANLALEFGGTSNADPQNPQFDQLVIGGAALLDGMFSVNLVDLGAGQFDPQLGDTFHVLTAAGGITGAFDSMELPLLEAGLQWYSQIDANSLILKVVERFPGDYNGGGFVGPADYVLWRKSLGNTGDALVADSTGPNGEPDGLVDGYDYAVWRSNYGKLRTVWASSAAGPGGTVPEPATATLLLVIGALASARRYRYQSLPSPSHAI